MDTVSEKDLHTMAQCVAMGEVSLIPADKLSAALRELIGGRVKLAAAEKEQGEKEREWQKAYSEQIEIHNELISEERNKAERHEAMALKYRKERDEAYAHNAVFRQALERISKSDAGCEIMCWRNGNDGNGEYSVHVQDFIKDVLVTTPSDSAAKVQKLIDYVESDAKNGRRGWIKETAQKTLAEWRG